MELEKNASGSILMKSVSILIPCFNAENYIAETLNSVFSNISSSDEIILIDDHSSDNTLEIATRLLKNSGCAFQASTNPKKGACSARNHALKISQGQYIQWLDADDILGPNKLSTQRDALLGQSNFIITSPFRPFRKSIDKGLIKDSRSWNFEKTNLAADWMSMDPMCIPACWLIPRSCAEKAGPWDESLSVNQDGEYFARVIACIDKILFTDAVEVFYRREGQGVSKFTPEKADSLFRSTEAISTTALQLENSQRMRQMISNRWQHFIYTVYPHAPKLQELAQKKLQHLPKPNTTNPNAVSTASRAFSTIFGWKALTHARFLTNKFRGS